MNSYFENMKTLMKFFLFKCLSRYHLPFANLREVKSFKIFKNNRKRWQPPIMQPVRRPATTWGDNESWLLRRLCWLLALGEHLWVALVDRDEVLDDLHARQELK